MKLIKCIRYAWSYSYTVSGMAGQTSVTLKITIVQETIAPYKGQHNFLNQNNESIYERLVTSKATASNATNSKTKLRSLINAQNAILNALLLDLDVLHALKSTIRSDKFKSVVDRLTVTIAKL